jgi:hypothetical protein
VGCLRRRSSFEPALKIKTCPVRPSVFDWTSDHRRGGRRCRDLGLGRARPAAGSRRSTPGWRGGREEHEATRTIRGATCGVERWPVKTLSDPGARQVDFAVRPATVRYLGTLRASPGGQDSRGPLEARVFRVQARLVGVKREADSDYHLILSQGGATMIAEMPVAACTSGAQRRYAMSAARAELERAVGGPVGESWIRSGLRVRVVGVLFFDLPHGQTGHSRNYAELHPVTGFRVLASP